MDDINDVSYTNFLFIMLVAFHSHSFYSTARKMATEY